MLKNLRNHKKKLLTLTILLSVVVGVLFAQTYNSIRVRYLTVDRASSFNSTLTLSGTVTHGAGVVSDTDGTDALGTSSVFWSALYSDQIFLQKGTDVASAADNFTLPTDGMYFDVTGTTGIDSIAASTTGRIVILQFDSTPTVTDGGNLILAGNLVATANDILVLYCLGNDWIEISRSVN